jgi:hypothetical protein
MALEDYGRIMGNAAASQPDFAGAVMGGFQQAQLMQQQQQAMQAKQAYEAQLQTDIANALRNPTSAAFSDLMARHPDLSKEFKDAWDVRDEGARNSDLTTLGGVVSSLGAGRRDLALESVKARVEADRAAGVDNQAGEMLLEALEAGDDTRARGLASYLIAAAAGPEKLDALTNASAGTTVVSAGGSLVDKTTGKELFRAGEAPKYLKAQNADGSETIIAVGGDAGASAGAPRSVRNNNPGNIEDGAFARSQPGYVGSDGRFAIFEAPEAGQGAAMALLGSYIDRGFNSVGKIISRWAPKEDNNDTAAYVRTVASKLGVKPAQPIGKDRVPDLLVAIAEVEGGAGVSGGAPGARAVFQSQGGVKAPLGYRPTADGNLEAIPGGPGDLAAKLKPVPVAGFKAIQENRTALGKLEKALAEVSKYPEAFGAKGYLPDFALQRVDPAGVKARAAVADIGSMVINQRSGAAVSAAEFPRLSPFIPSMRDDPETVTAKLANMRAEMAAMVAEDEEFYSPANGYRPVAARKAPADAAPGSSEASAVKVATRAELEALPSGTWVIVPGKAKPVQRK